MSSHTLSSAAYHRLTSYDRLRMTPHSLDWGNQPRLDKAYPPLERLPLAPSPPLPAISYAALVRGAGGKGNPAAAAVSPDVQTIAALLRLTHAVTARSMHGGQPFHYRSVASAGALYPFELYLAAHRVEGLAPGVYHHDLFTASLNVLRRGRVPLIPPAASGIAATLYIGGIFFRSAWKYRQRAYRYVLLDAGHLLENLRLALAALGLSFSIALDFDDEAAGTLLGMDSTREACLACVHILDGRADARQAAQPADLEPLSADIRDASRVSMEEKRYAPITEIHRAGFGGAVADGRTHCVDGLESQTADWQTLGSTPFRPSPDYVDVLARRRSRRNFIAAPMRQEQWAGILDLLTAAATASDSPWVLPAIGILAGDGVPVPPGFYRFDPHGRRLGRMASGNLIEAMSAACLDQMWLKNAAMHLMFIADPAALDRNWGARAYRYAMMAAGGLGQQAYLAAAALEIGACGIGAIYDREAAELLGLTDTGALLYLVALGPIKKP